MVARVCTTAPHLLVPHLGLDPASCVWGIYVIAFDRSRVYSSRF